MKNLLSVDQLQKVKEAISLELLKRGYPTEFLSFEETETSGVNRIEFHTADFQTAPVLFKSLSVGGFNSQIYKEELNRKGKSIDVINVYIDASVRWESFTGGTNGSTLFKVSFVFTPDSDRIQEMRIA